MAKYRITIENLEGGDYEGTGTVDMENLVIFGKPADSEKDSAVIIHGTALIDIAAHLVEDEHLLHAVLIANGLYAAEQAAALKKREELMDKILGGAFGMISYTIGLKITAYEELREQAEELKAQLDELNKRKDAMEAEVISAILDAQEETGVEDMRVSYDGRNYSVTTKNYYSIPKPHRDAAFEEMRNLGMGDLIQEKVDDRTLTKELEAAREEGGGELPEEYSGLAEMLTQYTKTTLRRVKA